MKDLTNKNCVVTALKETMGRKKSVTVEGEQQEETIKTFLTRQTRSKAKIDNSLISTSINISKEVIKTNSTNAIVLSSDEIKINEEEKLACKHNISNDGKSATIQGNILTTKIQLPNIFSDAIKTVLRSAALKLLLHKSPKSKSPTPKSPIPKSSKSKAPIPESPVSKSADISRITRATQKAATAKNVEASVSKVEQIASRKSTRLSTQSKLASPMSSSKLASPIMKSKKPKSPAAGKSILESKKIPIWKTEPKPESVHSAIDDVYDFEYDANDCKIKKKRTKKPRTDTIYKPKNTQAPTKRAKRLPRNALKSAAVDGIVKNLPSEERVLEDIETSVQPISVAIKSANVPETTVLVVDKAAKANIDSLDHSSPIVTLSEPNEISIFENVEPVSETMEAEKSIESSVLAGGSDVMDTTAETEKTQTYNISLMEPNVNNCFGFEDDVEVEIPTDVPIKNVDQLVKSTPIKVQAKQKVVAPFVSPVKKVTQISRKSGSRPARIDQDVALNLIRGVRPLQPTNTKQKQSSLLQYINEVGDVENNEPEQRLKTVPATPPSAFLQVNLLLC